MNVAVYIRVSTEDQAKEGYSLEVQGESSPDFFEIKAGRTMYLESFAKREGLEIFKIYQDDGISGYSTERPALKQLLKDAKQKKFDLVLVYKIDRFSRNLKDLLNLVDEFFSCGVGFKSATEPFDTTTSAGKLMFQQLGSFAEFERNRIAERVFPGMIKGVQQGNWQGARYAPYGYRYNKDKKLLEIDEQESKVVKLIYTMFLCDKSIFAITEYLTKKGYRNRKGNIFSTKLIGDILKNRMYTGKLVWNSHYYDKSQKTKKGYRYIKNPPDKVIISQGRHQPIITDDDFEAVQEKLKARRIERRKKANDYPLSGILYCAKCNHKYLGLSSISNHRTGVKKRWYRCMGPYRSFIRCKNKSVKAQEIESEVAEILETLLKNDKLKTSQWTTGTLQNGANFPHFGENAKIDFSEVKDKLKSNQEKQSKLTDAYLENLLSEDVYREKIVTLRNEEESLKKLLVGYEVRELERERSEGYINRVKDFLDGYDDSKEKISFAYKKQLAGMLFKNIKIAPAIDGALPPKRISFFLFAPLIFCFRKRKRNCNVRGIKRLQKYAKKNLHTHLRLSDERI